MTAQEWLERFDALCQEAWELGRLDITDTAWVSPDLARQLRESAPTRPMPFVTMSTAEHADDFLRRLYAGKAVMNMVTGSLVVIEETQ